MFLKKIAESAPVTYNPFLASISASAEIGGICVLKIRSEGKRNKRVEIALES